MPKFKLQAVDLSFFETASFRWTYHIDVVATPEQVWEGLVAYHPLAWCKLLSGHYTSALPYGVGTTREVSAAGIVKLYEEFFYWNDDERRHCFHVLQSNVPFLQSFAEDYHVKPIEGGARLTWRFAFEPKKGFYTMMKLSRLANELLFSTFVKDTHRHFGRLHAKT